jgi:hypothetical protein
MPSCIEEALMAEEQTIQLLEEIRDLQHQQLQLAQENHRRYEESVKTYDKELRRGKKAQIGFVVVMFLFLLFIIYAEWFLDGIPKPSWVK